MMKTNPGTWGNPPYKVVVVHGGPGAPGSMTPVARVLSEKFGVLEPFQTGHSIQEQIDELADILKNQGISPVTLIGWSWGAILSYMTTSLYPALVEKLILISMPPLLPASRKIPEEWFYRLTDEERSEFNTLEEFVWDGVKEDKDSSLSRLFQLFTKGDSFSFLPFDDTRHGAQLDINISVGLEMRKLLIDRRLLEIGRGIFCPVVVIQGDNDLRCPVDKIREPLIQVIRDFKLIKLDKCGHYPWFERHARDRFFNILFEELSKT